MQREVKLAGFGGQGIMTVGKLLALAGMEEGKQVCWIPSYGPEMRGGTAYCTVVISNRDIGSPVINNPQSLVAFNRPSLEKFGPLVKPNGLIVINSSLIDISSERTDLDEIQVPFNDIANSLDNGRSINIVALGAFVARSGIVAVETQEHIIREKFARKPKVLELNLETFRAGVARARAQSEGKGA
jgi:2-oxoglutarate ferredoxin oxidoreductase subunit gamma